MVILNRFKKVVVLTLTIKGKNKKLPNIIEGILKLSGYALPNTSWFVPTRFSARSGFGWGGGVK